MAPPLNFHLPTASDRIGVIGQTGCGKTQCGAWHLSNASIETRPWVILDYKREELLNSIPYAREIGFNEIPKHPGVHILHARPEVDNDAMENFLWKIHARGNTGLFVDEAYVMPDKGAYQTVLTQGRSLKIPMINLTQQASWIPRHVFSESQFFNVFFLADDRDRKRVKEFTRLDLEQEIPEYHSWYYDVKRRQKFLLRPVPDADSILEVLGARLAPKRRLL
jgi:hypothetical protein